MSHLHLAWNPVPKPEHPQVLVVPMPEAQCPQAVQAV
jgi:hypothetical protein